MSRDSGSSLAAIAFSMFGGKGMANCQFVTLFSPSVFAGKGGVSGKGFCHCPIPSCTTAKGKVGTP